MTWKTYLCAKLGKKEGTSAANLLIVGLFSALSDNV